MSSQISSADYWQKAYDSLSSELQANFQHIPTGKRDILEVLLKTVEGKREICSRKRWRLTLPNGRVVAVRDVMEKITRWIQCFIAVGDAAVQYNTASAAIPWAAFRFLLQIAVNDAQVESALVSDLETISRLIARYREFERIHLQRNSTLKSRIEECLTRLYADVLSFLSMAVGYFGSKTLARTAKNAFRVSGVNHSQRILEQEAELLKIAGLSDSEKLYYLEDSVACLVDRNAIRDKEIEEAKHLKLVQWLSKVPVSAHHTLRSEERMPGSALWLLDRHEYKSWKYSTSSATLLLHGIAGSGKSIICSAVIDSYLKERDKNSQIARFAYFYCADCKFEPERSQPSEILRSILKQLVIDKSLQHVVPDFIHSEFDRRVAQSDVDGLEVQRLSIQDCIKLIQKVTSEYPVTIVIDALDEIEEFSRPLLIEALKQIIADSVNVVNIFLTTRNDSHIFALLSDDHDESIMKCLTLGGADLQKICISREDTVVDMEAYVKLQLSIMKSGRHLLKGKVSSQLSQVLVDKLLNGAGEMFQWVSIQFRHLCHQDREEDIMEILDNDKFAALDDIYAAVLESILRKGGVSCDIAIRTFSWLLFMQESISSQSLLSIVTRQLLSIGAEFQSSDLMNICSNLVFLDEKRDTFRFSHQSVQEFLRKHKRLSADAANLIISNSCIQLCIEGPSLEDEGEHQSSIAIYRYAAMYWPYHTSAINEKQNHDAILADVLSFIYDGPNDTSLAFMTWMDQVEQITHTLSNDHPMHIIQDAIPGSGYTPLFLASIFGIMGLIEAIAETSGDQAWDQVNHRGNTSLYLACVCGHLSIARALISYGANTNVRCGRFGSCLQAACFHGHTAVVSLLLAQGTPIHQPGAFSNALEAAFRGQQEETALLLLQQDSAIRNHEDYWESIGGAALSGFLRVLEHLETSPLTSIYNMQVDRMKFKIAKAIRGGQHGVLTRFLKNSPDIAAILPQDAVALAAVYGHDAVVKLLADKGIGLEGGQSLGSPLRCASLMNRESTVRLLINLGADVNMLDSYGTALQAASMNGHSSIVKLLLAEGAKVNQQGGIYGTALQAAAYHGHLEIVDLLFESNASTSISGLAKDAFRAAVEGGHYDIVQHMLRKSLLDKRPEYVNLMYEPRCYNEIPQPVYKSLLRDSSPSRKLSDEPRLPFLSTTVVSEQHGTECEDTLAAMGEMRAGSALKGSPVNLKFVCSDSKDCPLATCADAGNIMAVSAVLERKRKLGLGHKDIVRALKAAASNGHIDIMNRLLEHIPVPLPVADGFEILGQAVSNCHLEATNLLLERIDSDGWDRKSLQDLIIRACRANVPAIEAIVPFSQTLLSVEDVNKTLETAFPQAADEGNDEVKVNVIDWIYKRIGNASQGYCRDIFKVACNRSLQSTTARILQIAGKNGISKEDIMQGITICASKGCAELLAYLNDFLLSQGGEVSNVDLMRAACKNGNLPVVNWLLKRPHQLSEVTLGLVIASSNGHSQVVQTLLEADADVNTTVTVSISDLNQRLVRFLNLEEDEVVTALQAVLNYIALPRSPFNFVDPGCVDDFEHVIRMLLDHGADVNLMGDNSRLPLHVAVAYGSQRLVRWLIDAGADVNAAVNDKNLLIAAAGREEYGFGIMQILQDSGVQLQSDADSLDRIFNATLQYFDITTEYGDDGSQGRFVYTNSLSDVFTTGPGAVLRFLLEKTHWKKTYAHFSFVLQMVCILGDGGYVDLLLERDVDVNTVCSYYGTALQAAARHGHIYIVQKLLKVGADPNVTGGAHSTALRAAVKSGHSGIVRALLSSGADLHLPLSSTSSSFTRIEDGSFLNLVAKLGNEAITSMLLKAGADANLSAAERKHALISACSSGNFKIVQHLLAAGVRPDVAVEGYWTINDSSYVEMTSLHMCCCHGNEKLMQLLLQNDVDPEVQIASETPVVFAAKRGFSGIIRLLIDAGANINHKSSHFRTPLSEAAEKGHWDAVRTLLEIGASVYDPAREINCLIYSWRTDSLPVLRLLAEAAVCVPHGKLAITKAIERWCNWKISGLIQNWSEAHLRLLIDYVGPSTEGLLAACILGSSSLVKTMIDSGVPVDEGITSGFRALRLAAYFLHPSVVQILLDHGANLHDHSSQTGSILNAAILGCVSKYLPHEAKPNSDRHTHILQFCDLQLNVSWTSWGFDQESNCEKIVQILVEHGIEVTDASFIFGTSLHLACFMGNESIITLLLSKGSDVNSNAGYFKTPLFAAIHNKHYETVELLLSHGADPNSCHPTFGPALSYAFQNEGIRIVELLLHHGADPNIKGTLERSLIADIMVNSFQLQQRRFSPLHRTRLVTQILNHHQPLKVCDSDLAAIIQSDFSIDGKYAAEILLENDTQMIVSEETIISLLEYYYQCSTQSDAILKLFLRRNGNKGATKAMLQHAQNLGQMNILLAHHPRCSITQEIVETQQSEELMALLLEHEPNMVSTQAMVIQILGHRKRFINRHKERIVDVLEELWRRNSALRVTEAMLKDVKFLDPDTVRFLLSHSPPDLQLSDNIFLAAGANYFYSVQVLRLLLQHKPNVRMEEETVAKILERHKSAEKLDIFIENEPDMIISERIFLAALPSRKEAFASKYSTLRRKALGEMKDVAKVLKKHRKTVEITDAVRKTIDGFFEPDRAAEKEMFYNGITV